MRWLNCIRVEWFYVGIIYKWLLRNWTLYNLLHRLLASSFWYIWKNEIASQYATLFPNLSHYILQKNRSGVRAKRLRKKEVGFCSIIRRITSSGYERNRKRLEVTKTANMAMAATKNKSYFWDFIFWLILSLRTIIWMRWVARV